MLLSTSYPLNGEAYRKETLSADKAKNNKIKLIKRKLKMLACTFYAGRVKKKKTPQRSVPHRARELILSSKAMGTMGRQIQVVGVRDRKSR